MILKMLFQNARNSFITNNVSYVQYLVINIIIHSGLE